jgi:hypothetical protein
MESHGECVVFALYGVQNSPASILGYWEFIDWLLQLLSIDRTEVECSAQHNDVAVTSGTCDDVAVFLRGRAGEAITSVQVMLRQSTTDSNQRDFRFTSGISISTGYLIVAMTDTFTLTPTLYTEILEYICRTLPPMYGIGYVAPARNEAIYYALGIVSTSSLPTTDTEWDEMEHISRWGHTGMHDQVYRKGLLRDVYRFNILSHELCHVKVKSLPLASWITETPSRGTLTPLPSKMWLWEIKEDNIALVRRAVSKAGLLFR